MSKPNSKSDLPERRLRKERLSPNIQRVVREVDSAALKQFLGGYVRFHPELNTSLKMLLGVQVGEVAGVDEIYGFIDDIWRKNRRKLNQKRSKKKLEFLLLSCVGVSADALSDKNYQLAAAQSLAMHQWMTQVGEDLYDEKWAIGLYRQLLEVIQGLVRSDMAPRLMTELIKSLIQDFEKPETRPYGGQDIWSQLYQSGKIDRNTFSEGLMKKLSSSDDPKAFFPAFLKHIELLSNDHRAEVMRWIQALPAMDVLDQLEADGLILNIEALFFMLSASEKWTLLQRDKLSVYIKDHHKFIVDLHHEAVEASSGIWQELKQKSSWTEEEREVLLRYRQKMADHKMVTFVVDQLLADRPLDLPAIEMWDWADRLRILPFISKKEQKQLIKEFKAYCLDYTDNHMGEKAIEHIRDLGRILLRMNYQKAWSQIEMSLRREFGYRKSFQKW